MSALVIRPAHADELQALGFGPLMSKPGFRADMFRVGLLHGQAVCQVLTEHYTLRYGSIHLRVAGVSNVYTAPEHRRSGYATATMQDALASMMEQGAHLALLFDAPCYFGRFGFSSVLPVYRVTFDSHTASALPQPLNLRPPVAQDIPQFAALFEAQWSGRVTFSRSQQLWAWRIMQDQQWQVLVAVDDSDQVCGYVAGKSFEDECVEVVAGTPDAAVTLLAECALRHQELGHRLVHLIMPPDDPVIAYVRHLLDVTVSAQHVTEGGWSARIINMPDLLNSIRPEIEAQASLSYPGIDPQNLSIDYRSDSIKIELRGSPPVKVYLTHKDFIQIMFGSLTPTEFGLRSNLPASSVALLQTLFPPRLAAIACWDWF